MYDIVPDGHFPDGEPAFRLLNLDEFTLHGITVKVGELSPFYIDANSAIVASWIFNKCSVRNSHIEYSMIGHKESGPSLLKDCVVRSCCIKAAQTVIRNAEINDVHASAIRFFGLVGTLDQPITLSKMRYTLSVSCYSGNYRDFRNQLDTLNEAG